MIAARKVWRIIREHTPKRQWLSWEEIYGIVEQHGNLDGEDWRPPTSRSTMPRWKILVRSVMVNRLKKGRFRSRKSLIPPQATAVS